MYLFIFESIGTSELILIALVALIFFGPRKLPELARMFGKAMNEFRRSTSEFKQVWEKEVASEVNQIKDDVNFASFTEDSKNGENTIAVKNQIAAPEIKEVSQENFQGVIAKENLQTEKEAEPEDALANKQNWL